MKSDLSNLNRKSCFSAVSGVLAILVSASLSAIWPWSAVAATLDGESRTYFQVKETSQDKHLLPLTEYLDLAVDNLYGENVSFQLGGWVRVDLNDEESFDNRHNNGDLQTAYLRLRGKTANRMLDAGRVFVNEGVALEQIDGLYGTTGLVWGFSLSAFGGVPVYADFDGRSGDSVFGGRLSHGQVGKYRVGLSYLKEKNDSSDFREEAGVDLWALPVEKVEITGRSSYNDITSGWMEHAYSAALGPFDKLRFVCDADWISYGDYFTSLSTSAFDLKAGSLDPKEKVRSLGISADYPVQENLSVSLNFKNYDYSMAGNANYYGGQVTFTSEETLGGGFSYHRMDGETDRLKYSEYRLYGYKSLGKTGVTADFFAVSYDEEINGEDWVYSAALAVAYELTENLELGTDLNYSHDPDFDHDIRFLLKAHYLFGTN